MISIAPPETTKLSNSQRYVYDILSKQTPGTITEAEDLLLLLKHGGFSYSYPELVSVLKTFDGWGFGHFIVGRHGSKTRFQLSFQLKPLQDNPEIEQTTVKTQMSGESGTYESHIFKLRPDFTVEVRLPTNFTHREAERLSTFLRALPREEAGSEGNSNGR